MTGYLCQEVTSGRNEVKSRTRPSTVQQQVIQLCSRVRVTIRFRVKMRVRLTERVAVTVGLGLGLRSDSE